MRHAHAGHRNRRYEPVDDWPPRIGSEGPKDRRQRSKGEGYVLIPGDWIAVKTPGGGGYGSAAERDPAMVQTDIARGYYTTDEAVRLFTRPAAPE
jgi:N-methylhydantoinase B/oxoprolinase/acetone carboxylase alpha subunit